MPRAGGARHELVDHTSEITLRLRAPSYPLLVAEAARAFAGLVPDSSKLTASGEWRVLHVSGGDRAGGLVDLLNELVYLGEVDQWLPLEVEAEQEGASGVRLRARGAELKEPFVFVKAATLHNATVRDVPGGVVGEVTLDV